MMFKKLLFVIALLLSVIPLVSYAQDDDVETVSMFLGTVTDSPDEFVGLVIDGDKAILYLCDGQADLDTVSFAEWFMGTVEDGTLSVVNASGNSVEVSVSDESATGQFTFADGTTKEFVLDPADGEAGLYRSEFAFGEDEFVGGWLVLADGSTRGAVLKKGSTTIVPASLNANVASSLGKKELPIQDGTSNTVN